MEFRPKIWKQATPARMLGVWRKGMPFVQPRSTTTETPPRPNWNNEWQAENRAQTPPSHPQWNRNDGYRNNNRPQTPSANQNLNRNSQQSNAPPRTEAETCWICGITGCRSWYHNDENRPNTPTVPPNSQTGNDRGTLSTGSQGPSQPARPRSN